MIKRLHQCSGKAHYAWNRVIAVLLTGFILLSSNVRAQYVPIPDPNFVAYLQSNYPACMSGTLLDTVCCANITNVTVPNSGIQDLTGIQYFDNLLTLDCHGNLLSSLPPLPANINILNINDNQFLTPPVLPPTLAQFYCNNNQFTNLPALPPGLNILSCNNNLISSIPSLVIGLTYLAASNNFLTSLPPLPNSLTSLVISDNQITSLPTLPTSLEILTCNDNLLTSLPPLPLSLLELKCSSNQLQQIPALPPGLDFLSCAVNQLTSLPALPLSLNSLSAHDNFLTDLLPFPMPVFSCSIDISNNPISCLPHLPDSIAIIICGTNIQCIPNIPAGFVYGNCGDTLPPICSATSECLAYNVSGYAFEDLNNNCFFDTGEPALAGRVISINAGQYYAYTDSNGYYTFYTGLPGSYELSQVNADPTLWDLPCNGNVISVTVINPLDTFNNRNFPNQTVSFCALPTVDVASGAQQLCYGGNTYTVNYCNKGTLTGFNTHIDIEFDPEIIPLSSTLPWTSVSGNIYTFDVGTLSSGDCGSFTITDSISCDALIDQTACVRANIFPDSTCEAISPLWDQSNLTVTGACSNSSDSIIFSLKNTGIGNMLNPILATIYEDDLLMSVIVVQLNSGDDSTFAFPSDGKTYRMEAQQTPNHPGRSQPRSFVELCGSGSFSLNKIIPVAQDDADEWVEIDCHLITGAYAPNVKTVQPSGVGPLHLVTASDDLDYIIQFQNTGVDTVFNVLIIDTLDSQYLDISSVEPGPSSHPYSFSLNDKGVAKFALNSILLPDSSVNKEASHGFVKYKIRQKPGNAPGTVINDVATIYFDYNAGLATDTAFVTIADKDSIFPGPVFVASLQNGYDIVVSPNPFEELIRFKIEGSVLKKNFAVSMYNLLGEEIYHTGKIQSSSFAVNPDIKESGIYFYRVYNNNELIGAGKLIRK